MESIIPQTVVEVIAVITGVIVSVGIPYIANQFRKLNRTYTTVFGVEDVEEIEGLVGIIQSHEDTLSQIKNTQDDIKETVSDMKRKMD